MSILACLINPFGINGALYPFRIMEEIQYSVTENSTILSFYRQGNIYSVFLHFEILFAISVLMLSIWIRNYKEAKGKTYLLIWLIAFGLLALWRVRAMALFAYIFLLFAAQTVALIQVNKKFNATKVFQIAGLSLIFLLLLLRVPHYVPEAVHYKFGLGVDKDLPDAARFFKSRKLKGPVFNNFDVGDYLIYYLFPEEKVFVDSRPEAYPPGFFDKTLVPAFFDERKWLELDYKYDFNVIFLGKHIQVRKFINRRIEDNAWFVAYNDRYSIIFVKWNNKNSRLLKDKLINLRNTELIKTGLMESEFYGSR